MREGKMGTLVLLPTQSDSNGFVNRRSTVQSRPPAPGSSYSEKTSNHEAFIAAAGAAGASDLGARALERDLLGLARGSRNGELSDGAVAGEAQRIIVSAMGAWRPVEVAVAASMLLAGGGTGASS